MGMMKGAMHGYILGVRVVFNLKSNSKVKTVY